METSIHKIGYRSGLAAFGATVTFVVVQIMQLAHMFNSPTDEVLIYAASLCIVIPFILEMLALHHITPREKKFWSHAALIFTILYAVFVTANYVVQLATVIPMRMNGQGKEIALLEQTPHSLFWDFDALGYIFMGIAMVFAVPALEKSGRQKAARIALLANGLVTPLITFVYFYPDFSEKLLLIGFPWAITAPWAMLTLALAFRSIGEH